MFTDREFKETLNKISKELLILLNKNLRKLKLDKFITAKIIAHKVDTKLSEFPNPKGFREFLLKRSSGGHPYIFLENNVVGFELISEDQPGRILLVIYWAGLPVKSYNFYCNDESYIEQVKNEIFAKMIDYLKKNRKRIV